MKQQIGIYNCKSELNCTTDLVGTDAKNLKKSDSLYNACRKFTFVDNVCGAQFRARSQKLLLGSGRGVESLSCLGKVFHSPLLSTCRWVGVHFPDFTRLCNKQLGSWREARKLSSHWLFHFSLCLIAQVFHLCRALVPFPLKVPTWLEHFAMHQKVSGLISGQEATYPCFFLISIFVSLSPFLSLSPHPRFLSLFLSFAFVKSTNISLGED